MVRCGYLSQKLVTGRSLKGGESDSTPILIARDLSKMVKLSPWTRCVVPFALRRFRDTFFGRFFRPSWYLPSHLGGYGLDPSLAPADWRMNITKEQRLMASQFISDPTLQLFSRMGVNIPTAKYSGVILRPRIIVGDYVPTDSELEVSVDPWMGRIAYAARAAGMIKPSDSSVQFKSKFIKRDYRLKPMSDEGIDKYWCSRLFVSKTCDCPDLAPIRPYVGEGDLWFTYERTVKRHYQGVTSYSYEEIPVRKAPQPISDGDRTEMLILGTFSGARRKQ